MGVQPFTIDTEAEAKEFLTNLLAKPEFRSMDVIEQRCAILVKDPKMKAYFLATGAEMLAATRGTVS